MRNLVTGCILLLLFPGIASGQWVESRGAGWLQVSLYHHDTQSRFDPEGNQVPLFNEGSRSVTTSLFLTGVYGAYRGVDVWLQLPLHRLTFNDIAAERTSTGLGDPLLHVRVGPELFGVQRRIPVALRGGVKWPVGDFPVDAEIIPLTQGQRDWELLLEAGHSFYPAPLYAMGWVGYRWRETNTKINLKPGDERFVYAAVGGGRGRPAWKLAFEGMWGKKWVGFAGVRVPLAFSERRLVQLMPSVSWEIGGGNAELGARMPLAGQNLPAGPALFLGYFHRFRSR